MKIAKLFLTGLLSMLVLAPAQGADETKPQKVTLSALLSETQKMSDDPSVMSLIWWIPTVYWQTALEQDKNVTADQLKALLAIVEPYTIVAVSDGAIGRGGQVTFTPEATIRESIHLTNNAGIKFPPIAPADLPADVRDLLASMRPVLANTIGPMGENLHFFVFPGGDGKDQAIADPTKPGAFSLGFAKKTFRWRLPLASLLSRKTCAECTESLPGTFQFCPYDGKKLN